MTRNLPGESAILHALLLCADPTPAATYHKLLLTYETNPALWRDIIAFAKYIEEREKELQELAAQASAHHLLLTRAGDFLPTFEAPTATDEQWTRLLALALDMHRALAAMTATSGVAQVVAWLRTAEALAGPGPYKSLEVPIRLDVIRNLIDAIKRGEHLSSPSATPDDVGKIVAWLRSNPPQFHEWGPSEYADAIERGDWRDTPSNGGWRDILAERRRQIDAEGYTLEHDDAHVHGEIANAAADYALPGQSPLSGSWAADKALKPRRQQLVIAGALILAEIERIDRIPAAFRTINIRRAPG